MELKPANQQKLMHNLEAHTEPKKQYVIVDADTPDVYHMDGIIAEMESKNANFIMKNFDGLNCVSIDGRHRTVPQMLYDIFKRGYYITFEEENGKIVIICDRMKKYIDDSGKSPIYRMKELKSDLDRLETINADDRMQAKGMAYELILTVCSGLRKVGIIKPEEVFYNNALGDVFDYIIENCKEYLLPHTVQQGRWKRDH